MSLKLPPQSIVDDEWQRVRLFMLRVGMNAEDLDKYRPRASLELIKWRHQQHLKLIHRCRRRPEYRTRYNGLIRHQWTICKRLRRKFEMETTRFYAHTRALQEEHGRG